MTRKKQGTFVNYHTGLVESGWDCIMAVVAVIVVVI